MAIIVEDGTIVTDANSYVSLAEADAYAADALSPADWDAKTDAEKESLLVATTRWLDQNARWKGHKVDRTAVNNLRWPRAGVYDRDELPIAEDVIPEQLRQAVMELAMFLAVADNNPTRISDNQGIEEITVDVITLRFTEGYNQSARRFFPGLNTLLYNLGSVVGASGRGFAPIQRA